MKTWLENVYSHEVLPGVVKWASRAIYWLSVSIFYKVGSMLQFGFQNMSGYGLILGLIVSFKIQQLYSAWILGWGYEGTWNEPPPGRD